MPFNINDFHSQIAKTGGIAVTSNFEVVFTTIPDKLRDRINFNTDEMRFRIESVDTPQRSIGIIDYRDYGVPYKMGGMSNYIDITMQIILSPDYREREFFMAWQDLISGNHRKENLTNEEKKNQFNIGYYDDYVCKQGVEIRQYVENSKDPVHVFRLIDAFPLSIGTITLSWSDSNAARISVTMGYRHFVDESRFLNGQPSNRQTSILSRINQSGLGGAINTGLGLIL